MRKISILLLGLMLVAGLTSAEAAQEKDGAAKSGKPGAVIVDVVN